MSKSSGPTTATRPLRRRLAAVALSLALMAGGSVALASQASAATFGSVWVVASASYSCPSHTVTIQPTTNEPLNGLHSVYSYAQVYDYNLGRWITTSWMLDTGISSHIFYGITNPYAYAYVTYARYMNGAWVYHQDRVTITADLDNMGVFCNP